ncbi:unnamed protein product [Prorocentrum cordatum]|uniref:Uncharacterized protein n=1 Tax=Prorocentrum cordatum TaxID=2364126 RepID=A0ABN9Q0E2_9DINO|nr:unnamed protein product [Polarella glacialis]
MDAVSRACRSPRPAWTKGLVIQNMRKHGPNNTVYEECLRTQFAGKPFLMQQNLSKWTQSLLYSNWPEVVDELSWADAWMRDGTCTGLDPDCFFKEAVEMHQNVGTSEIIRLAVGQSVRTIDVLEAYGSSAVVLKCHGSNLSAVYTCWSGVQRVDCPEELQDRLSCGPQLYVHDFDKSSGQSQFLTCVWLVQYVVLLCRFAGSWRADCRAQRRARRARRPCCICTWASLGRFCPRALSWRAEAPPPPAAEASSCCESCPCWSRRTPIQFLGVVHAGTGVFSELWAILSDAAGETGLAMWPWLSVLELESNLLISVLMLFWYSYMCHILGCARKRRVYYMVFFWTCLALAWAGFYLKVNIMRRSVQDMKQVEMDPVTSVSLMYYIINLILEVVCLFQVLKLQGALNRTGAYSSILKRVVVINLVSVIASSAMLCVHIDRRCLRGVTAATCPSRHAQGSQMLGHTLAKLLNCAFIQPVRRPFGCRSSCRFTWMAGILGQWACSSSFGT